MQNKLANLSDYHAILLVGYADQQSICESFSAGPADFHLLSEPTIKIEKIRELIHWLNLRPMQGTQKLALIENADLMTTEAANALLKTLEEPPSYGHIILQTLDEQRILPTIQSRCQKIRLSFSLNQEKPEIYLLPEEIAKMSVKEKFDFVAKLADEETLIIKTVLTFWQESFRQGLLGGDDKIVILQAIARAKDLLETNISVKLLLENLVLNFD